MAGITNITAEPDEVALAFLHGWFYAKGTDSPTTMEFAEAMDALMDWQAHQLTE